MCIASIFPGNHLPPDIREKVAVDFYRTQRTFEGHISLRRGDSELAPVGRGGHGDAGETAFLRLAL